jgi:hypothetical protein
MLDKVEVGGVKARVVRGIQPVEGVPLGRRQVGVRQHSHFDWRRTLDLDGD